MPFSAAVGHDLPVSFPAPASYSAGLSRTFRRDREPRPREAVLAWPLSLFPLPLSKVPPTAKKPASKAAKGDDPNEKVIAHNRKARHNYEVVDTLECGIMLVGSEVKSLRAGLVSIEEAYARMEKREVWLVAADIQEYKNANAWNHEPKRRRKLLLHRREIDKFAGFAYEKNFTLVPLKLYFKEGRAKVLLGICRGKKNYDKRESIKKGDMQRDIDRAMRRGR
ncbi:SsrA-binding protein SmpB [Lacipirellula parvula]|uniref:SsrA-binding protein SmpB n=1 Tax=Lacipirellula parvula TaxID=2650471 RepID=UPI0030840EE7